MGYVETERDLDVVKFVRRNPCTSITIADIFYHGNRVIANRRLRRMVEYGYLQKTREYIAQPYFYYHSRHRPKQYKHCDLIARSYLFLINAGYEILKWEREPTNLKGIRPDAKAVVCKNGKTGTIYVEVERYHNCLKAKIKKYENNYNEDNPFSLLYCCDDRCDITTKIKVTQIKLDML